MALAYVARFATSAGRLRSYCLRKLRERGHVGVDDGTPPPDVGALVQKFIDKGFVDDAGFARMKAGGLARRGYGARRIGEALRGDGIAEELRAEVMPDEEGLREAAAAYARRRRFGPYARERLASGDFAAREKHLAALMRAGHDHIRACIILDAPSEAAVEEWIAEARTEEDYG